MKEKRGDIISGIVIAIIAVIYYAYSFQIQQTTSDILGSRFFPQLAAILLFGLSVIQIVQALRKKVPADEEGADGKAPSEGGKTIKSASRVDYGGPFCILLFSSENWIYDHIYTVSLVRMLGSYA